MKGVDVPIIPVNLDGVWGSIFSFERGRFLWKIPRACAISGDGQLRYSPCRLRPRAIEVRKCRAGAAGRGLPAAQTAHEAARPRLHLHCAALPAALHDGRWQNSQGHVWLGADQNHLYRAPIAARKSASSRWSVFCCRPRLAARSPTCSYSAWPHCRESELHSLKRGDRLLRQPVRRGCRASPPKRLSSASQSCRFPGGPSFWKTLLAAPRVGEKLLALAFAWLTPRMAAEQELWQATLCERRAAWTTWPR